MDDEDDNNAISPSEIEFPEATNSMELISQTNIDCVTGEGEDVDPETGDPDFDLNLNLPDLPNQPDFANPDFIDPDGFTDPDYDDREFSFTEIEGVSELIERLNIDSFYPSDCSCDWSFTFKINGRNYGFDGFDSTNSGRETREITRAIFKLFATLIFILSIIKVLLSW